MKKILSKLKPQKVTLASKYNDEVLPRNITQKKKQKKERINEFKIHSGGFPFKHRLFSLFQYAHHWRKK